MKIVQSNDEVVQDIVEILGLKDQNVISLDIDMTAMNPVVVTVERYLTQKEAVQMKQSLQRYNLKLVKENQEEE